MYFVVSDRPKVLSPSDGILEEYKVHSHRALRSKVNDETLAQSETQLHIHTEEHLNVTRVAAEILAERIIANHQHRVTSEAELDLIPYPKSVKLTGGDEWDLSQQDACDKIAGRDVRCVSVSAPSQQVADVLELHFLRLVGAKAVRDTQSTLKITLVLDGALSPSGGPHKERYELRISSEEVLIASRSEHGLFNGIMTLRQLLRGPRLPALEIEDVPEYEWRGLMLDVSRHFFDKDAVKQLLHTMALFKLNRFHWHLSDDQGWRVPVEGYERLTEVGAFRDGTQLGHESATNDGKRYGGSYSAADVQEIVLFAKRLHIEVVPEIDLPGHTSAAIASYPNLGNTDAPGTETQVATQFGALPHTLNPSEASFTFVKDVLKQISSHIESSYFHIGGDEVNPVEWTKSALAKQFMSENHLASFKSIGGKFTQEAAEFVKSLGRCPIVWDEAMESDTKLPQDTVVMLWRSWLGEGELVAKAKGKGLSVVLCPQDHLYFDAWQAPGGKGERFDAIGGFTSLEKVYGLSMEEGSGATVLGAQGQLWSEYIAQGLPDLEYMAWPRGIALAEITWSGSRRPGFKKFKHRLGHALQELRELGVSFRGLDP